MKEVVVGGSGVVGHLLEPALGALAFALLEVGRVYAGHLLSFLNSAR